MARLYQFRIANEKSARAIFAVNNPMYSQPSNNKFDLHYLHVPEALEIVRNELTRFNGEGYKEEREIC